LENGSRAGNRKELWANNNSPATGLLNEYRNNGVGLIKRRGGKIHGLDYLDEHFKKMRVSSITTPVLRKFVSLLKSGELQKKIRERNPREHRAVRPLENATINRILALLRRAMNIARKDGLISVVPYFPTLREENARTGFVEPQQFRELLKHLAAHLHPLMVFLYTTGCRIGAAMKITWDMVSADWTKMFIPGELIKNRKPITLALPGELVAMLRKQFRKPGARVFDTKNLRREWAKTVIAAKMPNLIIHDLRRSGARNLRSSGVAETVIMSIGGWRTGSVFRRYAIVAEDDISKAMAALEQANGALAGNK
jgi:integrase